MKSILVVDDNRLIVSGLFRGLSSSSGNWRILTAGNGREALRILASNPVDLMLSDLQMPVMDGYDLLAHARKHYPLLPAIAMTGNYSAETGLRLQALGVTQTIEKPFSIKTLATRIADILEKIPCCSKDR